MIRYAFYDFEFGILKIGYTDTAVVLLKRSEQIDADNEPSMLSDLAFEQICEYLKGQRKVFDFPYELHGTEFQKEVWNNLRQIPHGETRTYKQIAAAAGSPKASRAVGMANNKNPLMIVVPCHRVVGADGNLIGYAGGLDMKKALLKLERSRVISTERQ
jgi:methylated-DNA-[protein]-cysteine S-methyltransferase